MASATMTMISFRPAAVVASADRKAGRRPGGGANWWTPIFGWPAEPDYVEAAARPAAPDAEGGGERRRKFAGMTEEKARELRMRMMETESFHDAMYHSAIAARLASDLRRRSQI